MSVKFNTEFIERVEYNYNMRGSGEHNIIKCNGMNLQEFNILFILTKSKDVKTV
jgi:hypothetical protein